MIKTTISLTAIEINVLVEGLTEHDFGPDDAVAERLWERLLTAARRLAEREDI